MKINIELDSNLNDIELIIRAPELTNETIELKNLIDTALSKTKKIIFYKNDAEYYITLENILYFETDDNKVFAHTTDNFYEVKYKLYELEEIIPYYYCRISKSTIINLKSIYSLEKSFSGSSTASFLKCNKKVHISRHYYKVVKEKLTEMR